MVLCERCRSIDFAKLLFDCLQQCKQKQEGNHDDTDGHSSQPDNSFRARQHDDIFELGRWVSDCELCKVIFEAFKRREVANPEVARDLPIVFRSRQNKIQVCYDSKEGLIKICGLDVYMNEADANECLRNCQIEEDESPPIFKMIEKNPGSKAATTVASNWLRNCLKNHSSCKPPPECRNPPKRLINVGNETRNPFLVDTSSVSGDIQWLSLSYCWGEQDPSMKLTSMKLTVNTMDMLRKEIILDTLDYRIRDAIIVTKALGIPYIWIDSLCIVQGGKEWNKEASKMNEIYGGSTVTLVVADSCSVIHGFLKERQSQYISISRLDTSEGGGSDTKPQGRVHLALEWDENEDSLLPNWSENKISTKRPWARRGWTMQEGLLSSRLLCYTSSQIIWKCCQEERYERGVTKSLERLVTKAQDTSDDLSFGSGWLWDLETFMKFKRLRDYLPSQRDKYLLSNPEVFRLWYELIEEYSPREFRDIQDRLVALSGLAKVFGNTIQCDDDDYVAGLWKPDLIRGLMWHTVDARLIPRRSCEGMLAANKTFPSWSWACVGCEAVKFHHKDDNSEPLSVVEDTHIDPCEHYQPFGAVISGSIVLNGPVKKLPRLYNKAWKSADVSMSELERHLSEIVERESPGPVEPKYSSPPGGHFAALQMLSDRYSLDLLVLETGEILNGITTYRRVGILTLVRPVHERTPPCVQARLQQLDNNLAARIGPRRKRAGSPKEDEPNSKVVAELEGETWCKESVTIV